jgi:hypothetical protein
MDRKSVAQRNAAEWRKPGGGYDQWRKGDAQRERDLPIGGVAPMRGQTRPAVNPRRKISRNLGRSGGR